MVSRRVSVALVLALAASGPGSTAAFPRETTAAAAASGAVVLDLVVRDKKGNPVADLRADEVELWEDGARKPFDGFRLAAGEPGAGARLVVFVFPRLSREEPILAQAAAEEFVKKQLSPGLSAAVLNVGGGLTAVQEFTSDPSALKDAIKRGLDPGAKSGDPDAQALFSLVQWLKDHPGRKTVLLFSAGLAVPPGSDDLVTSLAGLANRHRVTFYGVDPSGVQISRPSTELVQESPGLSSQLWGYGGGSRVGEDLQGGGRSFGSGPAGVSSSALARLAETTGGFVTERTNSFSKPMRRIAEDARGYYELAYAPGPPKADGSVHRLEVKVARDGAVVQARRDLLLGELAALVPAFEKRLDAALAAEPLPAEVEVWDRILHYGWDGKEVDHVVWASVPLEKMSLSEDTAAGRFTGEVSILTRVKDASGRAVATFSQVFPIGAPLDQLARARGASLPFVRRVKLPPGAYTLETAVADERASKVAARRTPFEVRPPEGIALSSLSLGDAVPAGPTPDPDDPLRVGDKRLVPNLGQPIKAGQAAMTLHSVVYPRLGSKEPANITITVRLGDQPVNTATAALPAPDAGGRIPYATALRMDVLPPGKYRFDVAVAQGPSRDEESLSFTIVP